METFRIALAVYHQLMRKGLKRILEQRKDLSVTVETADYSELIRISKGLSADLIILECSLPKLKGPKSIGELRRTIPVAKILFLTTVETMEFLPLIVSWGAEGYLLKEETENELFSAIDTIRQGKIYISPGISAIIMKRVDRGNGDTLDYVKPLTPREEQVLTLLAQGNTVKEIAASLTISRRTVERHREVIREKLNLKNIADLVRYAAKIGYV